MEIKLFCTFSKSRYVENSDMKSLLRLALALSSLGTTPESDSRQQLYAFASNYKWGTLIIQHPQKFITDPRPFQVKRQINECCAHKI
jgi:hypothetical protein